MKKHIFHDVELDLKVMEGRQYYFQDSEITIIYQNAIAIIIFMILIKRQ
jgi:hypothetical protein